MKIINVAGLIAAAIAVVSSGSPVTAADLGGPQGSMKDGYSAAPTMMHSAPGPCYFRGDVGYSWSRSPTASWPVTNSTVDYSKTPPVATYSYAGDTITDTKLDSTAFGGVGLGCGMGSRGFRGEVMLDQTGTRGFTGTPLNYSVTNINGTPPPNLNFVDPLHSSLKSTTLMVNVYKDLGSFGPVTPYLGAGVGVAYNKMSSVYFTDNPYLTNSIQGDSRLSLAWSLMAGIGYQLNDRAILDLGYRYMDYGKAQSGQIDSAGFVNPIVRVNDIAAHEFKVGLRYHFGASDSLPSYQPLK